MATRITSEVLNLRHNFTQEERLKMGDELASAYDRNASIDAEESVVKSQFKERRASVEQTIGALSRNLANGFMMENVSCELAYDTPNVGEVSYKRKDTGEVVKVRPMTDFERQMDLPLSNESGVVAVPPEESAKNIDEFFAKDDEAQEKEEEPVDSDEIPEGGDEVEDDEEDSEAVAEPAPEQENLLDPKHDAEFAAVDAPKKRGRPAGSKKQPVGFSRPTNASAIPDDF